MTLSSTNHRTDDHKSLSINVEHVKEPFVPSKSFDLSIHNCRCQKSKTGLILYPTDYHMKNVILLLCEQCYNYQSENNTQHEQLEKWYFNIYKDSKSFCYKSKFSQNEDGTFSFCTIRMNNNETFNIKERNLENWEKDIIQEIAVKKLKNSRQK